MRSTLRLANLVKEFESQKRTVRAVNDVSLDFPAGAFVTLLGPSGCGKTTILRMIAGLETPTSGEIYLDDKPITHVPPNKRETAMVFQNYALFPHLTVFENVAYGLRLRKVPEAELKRAVHEKLEMMGLSNMADRQPNQLSGGQQQRVALARALVMSPKILLFDEPLSNLDAKLRIQVRQDIRELQRNLGVTTVYVTHDQEEAMAISDYVVIMNGGQVEQAGSPEEIYFEPRNSFVADFIGGVNLIPGRMTGPDEAELLGRKVQVRNPYGIAAGQEVKVAVRPEEVTLGDGPFTGTVRRAVFLGRVTEYVIQVGDQRLVAVMHGQHRRMPEGAETTFNFNAGAPLALAR
ncbi:ABC transporter ATP-binding protein [Symbiobacterium thermophilum]|uniref:ABC transporter ATP-binding protein n=1 Tax=Symbiobacterium thermophilum TaxID=2734 RepID=UPI0035C74918